MPFFHEMAKLSLGSLASMAVPIVAVSFDEISQLATIQLSNFPNPFRSETTISYSLDKESYLRISMVNSLGKEVQVLEDGIKRSGAHLMKLYVDNMPGGVYFLITQTPNGIFTHKILIN